MDASLPQFPKIRCRHPYPREWNCSDGRSVFVPSICRPWSAQTGLGGLTKYPLCQFGVLPLLQSSFVSSSFNFTRHLCSVFRETMISASRHCYTGYLTSVPCTDHSINRQFIAHNRVFFYDAPVQLKQWQPLLLSSSARRELQIKVWEFVAAEFNLETDGMLGRYSFSDISGL